MKNEQRELMVKMVAIMICFAIAVFMAYLVSGSMPSVSNFLSNPIVLVVCFVIWVITELLPERKL